MSNINIINFEKLILKPFRKTTFTISKGGIDKLYMKMYIQAEDIAIHEMKKYDLLLTCKNLWSDAGLGGEHQDIPDVDDKVHKYRDERIQHHMNEMKEILFRYFEIEKVKAIEENKAEDTEVIKQNNSKL